MSVSLTRLSNILESESCSVCLESFDSENDSIFIHNDPGSNRLIHPIHEDCYRPWFEATWLSVGVLNCPECRMQINPDSVSALGVSLVNRNEKSDQVESMSILHMISRIIHALLLVNNHPLSELLQ